MSGRHPNGPRRLRRSVARQSLPRDSTRPDRREGHAHARFPIQLWNARFTASLVGVALLSIYLAKTLLLSCFPGHRRLLQQIGCFDAKLTSKSVNDVDAGGVDASLECTDIRAVDVRTVRQLFLREAFLSPIFSQIECQDLSDAHERGQRLVEYFTTEYSRQTGLADRSSMGA